VQVKSYHSSEGEGTAQRCQPSAVSIEPSAFSTQRSQRSVHHPRNGATMQLRA